VQLPAGLLALGQVALAADDPELVLVGRGQVDGPRRDGRAQVARVGDVQVGVRVGSRGTEREREREREDQMT